MMFLVATFSVLGHTLFGKRFNSSLISWSKQMVSKTHTSLCLSQENHLKSKRIMSKVLLLKLLGLLNQDQVILLNQSLLDQLARPLCILPTQTGLRVTEIFLLNSISGLTLWDGSSSTLLRLLEHVNFYGRKAILLMLLMSKLKDKCMTTCSSISEFTKKSLPFQCVKE